MKHIANILWIAAPVMSKVFRDCLPACVKFAKQGFFMSFFHEQCGKHIR